MALLPFPVPDDDRRAGFDEDDGLAASGKMSFLEHLDELRKRLIYSIIGIAAGCGIAYVFIGRIFDFIMHPLQEMLPAGGKLMFTSGAEPFMLYLKIGFLAGLFIASPWVLWQVWLFIAPGLYSNEKKFAIPFVFLSSVFFILGGLFAHFVAFPWTWKFFISFTTDYMIFMPKVDEAFSLYTKMILGFGIIFEMPTLVFFLARMGVVTAGFLIRSSKYAVLVIAIVAAVVSPGTDAVSMLIMAVPMLGLYGISILVAWIFGKSRRTAEA
ncbi:MAG TPA: twin-arginine translocase subunit TatC [Vicinamibacterales bacterium]|nr:twin-arginine translocase subunit TatC [Vicinamibacterales bacterium]